MAKQRARSVRRQRASVRERLRNHPLERVRRRIADLSNRVDETESRIVRLEKQEKQMAKDAGALKGELAQLTQDFDTETTAVASRLDAQAAAIQELKTKAEQGDGVTPDDLQAVLDGLSPISERLKALGADPAEPIPPEEPPVV